MEAKSEASIASCLPLVIADPDDIDASLRQLAALEARDHAHLDSEVCTVALRLSALMRSARACRAALVRAGCARAARVR
jgi:hypothetical protein